MGNICIISNNPLALSLYAVAGEAVKGGTREVFLAARNKIHQGALLINHPLSGSVKPNISPYKSLVLSTENGPVDFISLSLIEGALATLNKLHARQQNYSEQVLADFQVIDMDLLASAMRALPAEYHL